MVYCPHCMSPANGDVCARCGKNVRWQNGPGLLPVGTVLRGKKSYHIGAMLGQGGFGVTYIAMELTSHRRVAVKEYFPTRCARRSERNSVTITPIQGMESEFDNGHYSFYQEAVMLGNLEGMPAVVQGMEYLEANGTAYLVMEFLDGTPLYRIVDRKGKFLPDELLPRMFPLMRDMCKLHRRGIIHRDVSPDNIMWMPDGSLKLMDFGCAKAMSDGKLVQKAVKKGFTPIEQYQDDVNLQGTWTDVYALAATIYYCLTGVIPPESIQRYQQGVALPSLRAMGVPISPEADNTIMWGMALESKNRPVNMDAFSRQLFPAQMGNLPPSAVTYTPYPQQWPAAQTKAGYDANWRGRLR